MLSIQIAAEVSNHGKDVLLLTAEDAPAFTIRPRLTAADADIDRVHDVKLRGTTGDTGLVFPEDGDSLAALVAEHEAELVIVDPLMAHLGGNVNSYNDQSMRAALAPLYQIATDTGTTMLVLCHLNKNASGDALQRFGGTHGIPAAARSALLLAQDPDDEEDGPLRVLAHVKCNVGAKQRSLALEVEPVTLPGGFKTAQIPIRGFSEHQTSALLGPHIADKPTAVDEAVEFLRATLADGPLPVQDVQRAAREAEIRDETLKRAKSRLKVESEKTGFKGGWEWSLRRGSTLLDPLGVGDVDPLGESPVTTGDFEDASDEEGQCDEVNPLGDFEDAEPFHPQTPKLRLKATDFRHGPDAKFSDEKGRRRPLASVEPVPRLRERELAEARLAELRKQFPNDVQEAG